MRDVVNFKSGQFPMTIIWGTAVKLTIAVGCLGVVTVFVWVLTGLLKDLLAPTLRRLGDAMGALQSVHRKDGLLVIPIDSYRGRPLRNSGERIAMLALLCAGMSLHVQGQDASSVQAVSSASQPGQSAPPALFWQYGGFVDVGSLHDFNDPANHLFRGRGTAFHVNELNLNMTAVYLRKAPTEDSRWGVEATFQTGDDSLVFGYSATAPNLDGSWGLRHLGPTDVSYMLPVGKGLTLQGGIFSSFIGYDSLYAKDNFNYTRPWGADFTPYLMLGVNAQFLVTAKLSVAAFVVNGYWHLADANGVPSTGGQLSYKANERLSLKQTVLYGPHQSDTSIQFWRFLSDSIAEWKPGAATLAFEYQISEEKVATVGNPLALWMSSQLPMHYAFNKHWSATVRPEVAWDRSGRWTGSAQTIKAITSTLEYRLPYRVANAIFRVEHRWDDSRGPQGGFFTGPYLNDGVPGLTPSHHLLTVGVILTFDSSFQHRRKE
jgi:hypothetical protein